MGTGNKDLTQRRKGAKVKRTTADERRFTQVGSGVERCLACEADRVVFGVSNQFSLGWSEAAA
jgi:hypothetical protein